MNGRAECDALSGPFLVSRTGDAGSSERNDKVPNCTLIPDSTKGVDSFRQQDGGHGSRNPLRTV